MKTFDTCTLPEICFYSIGNEPKKARQINSNDDYLFINTSIEKRNDQEWTTTAQEYRKITAEIKALEKRQKQLRDALISMSDHVNSIGGGVRLEQHARRGVIEYSRIEELKGIDLDQYRGEMVTYWKVTEI
jgi:uncharacterized protein YhaN